MGRRKTIRLAFKGSRKREMYRFYKDIFDKHSPEELGITMQALYNAVAGKKGNGRYENKKIKIEETTLLNWD